LCDKIGARLTTQCSGPERFLKVVYEDPRLSCQFIISLDFELLWGVRDHVDKTSRYAGNILGAREAVPRMLNLFEANKIHATWATVGFLFCESKDELLSALPEIRPDYQDPRVSNYTYLDDVGKNEAADPYYFAPSLIDRIKQPPFQEIGTHTLSHYYCLEGGQSLDAFEADLRAAQALASHRGVEVRSIVFPRNQFALEHVDVCKRLGITSYRGNPRGWAYRPAKGSEETLTRRALRLVDAYTGLLGTHTFGAGERIQSNVPASRFFAAMHWPVGFTPPSASRGNQTWVDRGSTIR
jgi:peptidoglycan/xylan/chitin deacetylase (PgdA/CDA1 family)